MRFLAWIIRKKGYDGSPISVKAKNLKTHAGCAWVFLLRLFLRVVLGILVFSVGGVDSAGGGWRFSCVLSVRIGGESRLFLEQIRKIKLVGKIQNCGDFRNRIARADEHGFRDFYFLVQHVAIGAHTVISLKFAVYGALGYVQRGGNISDIRLAVQAFVEHILDRVPQLGIDVLMFFEIHLFGQSYQDLVHEAHHGKTDIVVIGRSLGDAHDFAELRFAIHAVHDGSIAQPDPRQKSVHIIAEEISPDEFEGFVGVGIVDVSAFRRKDHGVVRVQFVNVVAELKNALSFYDVGKNKVVAPFAGDIVFGGRRGNARYVENKRNIFVRAVHELSVFALRSPHNDVGATDKSYARHIATFPHLSGIFEYGLCPLHKL